MLCLDQLNITGRQPTRTSGAMRDTLPLALGRSDQGTYDSRIVCSFRGPLTTNRDHFKREESTNGCQISHNSGLVREGVVVAAHINMLGASPAKY